MRITIISIYLLCFSSVFVTSNDTLTTSNSLFINQTLISKGGKFELGFFQKGTPTRYYVGIWYKDIPSNDIVWVANRDSPSYCDTSFLRLGNKSNIVLLDGGSNIIWTTKQSNGRNPVLRLLDSGNLVIREAEDPDPSNFIWQSFDYPTDTIIPGQKLGWNRKTGLNRRIVSWNSLEDPSSGNFTSGLESDGDKEIYFKNVNQIIYRSGPWVGLRFSGIPEINYDTIAFNFTYYVGSDEVYYIANLPPTNKVKLRSKVSFDGVLEFWTWFPKTKQWNKFWNSRKDECDNYGTCGPYGVCNVTDLDVCKCPIGFKAKDSYGWGLRDYTNGCVRVTKLDCESDGFLMLENMKLPQTSSAFVDNTLNLDQCRDMCKKNCNCTAYASSKFIKKVGSGCIIWIDYLFDMRSFPQGGQTLYMRIAASELGGKCLSAPKVVAIVLSGVILICMFFLCFRKFGSKLKVWKTKKDGNDGLGIGLRTGQGSSAETSGSQEMLGENAPDVSLFNYNLVASSTDFFSDKNKLGQGGFGPVYKGMLPGGQEIAVKKLSRKSGQGMKEFKNEIMLIAKLQHRNLVRILGFCVLGEEKMLLYEYMPNKSLDCFIFDPSKRQQLDWRKRFTIIEGIARGLLYLHRDATQTIIHRDLKASNILLDGVMNPKISDFGIARIFGGDQHQGTTNRVVGTYGYMSPEYAMEGFFSERSDVYSFGVLMLEVITGLRNARFQFGEHQNLLEYAWELWSEGRTTEFIDSSIASSCPSNDEITRCIHIAMLCVQDSAVYRPTMSQVVLWLESDTLELPTPTKPTLSYSSSRLFIDIDCKKGVLGIESSNDMTITTLVARQASCSCSSNRSPY